MIKFLINYIHETLNEFIFTRQNDQFGVFPCFCFLIRVPRQKNSLFSHFRFKKYGSSYPRENKSSRFFIKKIDLLSGSKTLSKLCWCTGGYEDSFVFIKLLLPFSSSCVPECHGNLYFYWKFACIFIVISEYSKPKMHDLKSLKKFLVLTQRITSAWCGSLWRHVRAYLHGW